MTTAYMTISAPTDLPSSVMLMRFECESLVAAAMMPRGSSMSVRTRFSRSWLVAVSAIAYRSLRCAILLEGSSTNTTVVACSGRV